MLCHEAPRHCSTHISAVWVTGSESVHNPSDNMPQRVAVLQCKAAAPWLLRLHTTYRLCSKNTAAVCCKGDLCWLCSPPANRLEHLAACPWRNLASCSSSANRGQQVLLGMLTQHRIHRPRSCKHATAVRPTASCICPAVTSARRLEHPAMLSSCFS